MKLLKRFCLIFYTIFFGLVSCKHSKVNKKETTTVKPNIVYILADDLGYGDVSSLNKNSKIQTLNIDKLASQGVSFTDAHTSSSVCTPTRYGILTGRYNWRTTLKKGVLNGYSKALIPEDRKTIGDFLQDNGYKTATIGKWHLGWDWANVEQGNEAIDYSQKIKNGPTTLGFDEFYGFCGSLDMAPYVWVDNDQPTKIPVKETFSYEKPGSWRKGPTSEDFIHEQILVDIKDKTVNFINKNANKDKPFFVYMPLSAPHTPVLPIDQFKGKSKLNNPYGDFVLMVDWVVGEVMKSLESKGIADNTIVVFTSDNGCSNQADFEQLATKNHNPSYKFRGHKADIFEGGHRVPFIVSWPKKVKPSVSDQLICTTDFYATIADVLNKEIKQNEAEDSFSFLSELGLKTNKSIRKSIIHHSINGSFAFRKNDWKTIFCPGSGGWSNPRPRSKGIGLLPKIQLYNLKNDIGETNNLQHNHNEIVKAYREEMIEIITNGRSTIGKLQKNDGDDTWEQFKSLTIK